jgi:tetratricopeptide (TPR) repeat protein
MVAMISANLLSCGASRATGLTLVAAFALLAAACVPPVNGARAAKGGSGKVAEGNFAGTYLAARAARSARDMDAASTYFLRALAADPDDAQLLRRAFVATLAAGRVEESIRLAERLNKTEPRDGLAKVVLTVAAVKAGNFDKAAGYMAEAPEAGFSSLVAPMVSAWVQHGRGRKEVPAELTRLAQGTPLGPLYRYHLALINDLAGRPADAETQFKEIIERNAAGTLRMVDAYGRLLERQGRRDDARKVYRDYLARQPDNPVVTASLQRLGQGATPAPLVADAAAGLAEAFYGTAANLNREESGETQEAYLQLALHLVPNLDVARMLLGDIYENRRNWELAIASYRGIPRTSPYSEATRIRLAWAANELGRNDEAIAALRDVAAADGERTEALVTLGDVLRAKERYLEAAAEYGRAIERVGRPEERHWSLFYARGIAYERGKQWPRAEADFLKALELRPDQPLVLNYLGYTWVDMGMRLDEARRMIQRAVELRPNDGYIVDSLGWVLYRLGRFPEAVSQLERAVELRPEDPLINDHLGDAYWRVGRHAEARFQWRRALNLKPEADLIPIIRNKLEVGLAASSSAAVKRTGRNGG